MNGNGYIAITKAYLEDDDESVFAPRMWEVCESEEDCYGPFIELTADGREFVDSWCNDASIGYDLCYGKAHGLAAKYNQYELWQEIVDTPEFRVGDAPDW